MNVTFPTLNSYPLITVTPYGIPTGKWGLINVNDHGFTIVISQEENFDLMFSWRAEPSLDGYNMSFSDGTSATYDPMTGQTTVQTEAPVTQDAPIVTEMTTTSEDINAGNNPSNSRSIQVSNAPSSYIVIPTEAAAKRRNP